MSGRERGSLALIRFMIWLSRSSGLLVARLLLYPISAYFLLYAKEARTASRDYLNRVLGRRATWIDQFWHFFVFANVLLDRVLLASHRTDRLRFDVIGLEHLTAALADGRGCILLGSHLGSFDALCAFGRDAPVPVRPLMYRDNSGPYSRLLEQLDPHLRNNIIEIGSSSDSMLQVREALGRGEIVGVLADRTPSARRVVTVPFLGYPAAFPTGPFLLARQLHAPAVLFFGLRVAPQRYELRFEPFHSLPNDAGDEGRGISLAGAAAAFAAQLEAQCRAHPFNWFNFYPFWEVPTNAILPGRHDDVAVAESANRSSIYRSAKRS